MPPVVFNQPDLSNFFRDLRKEHLVPNEIGDASLFATLSARNKIKITKIIYVGTANSERKEFIRYILNSPSPFSIASSLRSKSYLSHNSALYLHGLIKKVPQEMCVNKEQSAKMSSNELAQEGIARAFKNNVKQSKYIWKWGKYSFILINGKHTGDFGVINLTLNNGEKVRTTDLERTLVDIIVRPNYSGGTKKLIKIYSFAKEKVSTREIIKTLEKLDYTYPYHQSIGFLMERAGYDSKELDQIRKLGIGYDFYLVHSMKDMEYDKGWRLYYPKGLK